MDKPLPVGFLIIGFLLFVASLLFWASGSLEGTYGVLGAILGAIFVIASFRSLKM